MKQLYVVVVKSALCKLKVICSQFSFYYCNGCESESISDL